jgi:aryl-alcohol dehydrogenase-like predicted oxidoreductase
MTWGFQNTAEEAAQQLDMASGFGVNFIDTAEGYPVPMDASTQGATDQAIAKWMKASKVPRDKVVLSTKVCGYNERYTWMRDSGEGTRLTREQITESVDKSLLRLGTDHIDLLQIHWPERSVGLVRGAGDAAAQQAPSERRLGAESFESQVESIGELLASGKIRSWGLSNENAEGVQAFLGACDTLGVAKPVCVQNAYSLLQRQDETDKLIDLLEANGMSYLPYSPLSGGVLSGKYSATRTKRSNTGGAMKKRSRLGLVRGYEDGFTKSQGPAAVELYCKAAQKFGVTPTQLAIALCASREFVTSTIIGATQLTQLAEDLQGFSVDWTQEMEDEVMKVYEQYPDPWRVQVAGMG